MKNKLLLILLAFSLAFASCSDNTMNPDPPEATPSSVYVFNEGNFSDANGSLTSFKPETGQTIQQVFKNVNGRVLAGIIQSMTEIDGQLFIALNSANKIEVVDAKTLQSIATIPMQTVPVQVASAGENSVYVTNLYSNTVSIIDLETNTVLSEGITVGKNPQNIITVGELTYVANNGFGESKTISVIDNTTDAVVKTITVGNGPTDFELDKQGRIWVVCSGLLAYDENWNRAPENDIPGSIYIVDSQTATVTDSVKIKGHPYDIALNAENNLGYLLKDGVYIVNMGNPALSNKLTTRTFSAVNYSAKENLIYFGVNKGYIQPGRVVRYNLQGAAVDSFPAGIAPSGFYFNQ